MKRYILLLSYVICAACFNVSAQSVGVLYGMTYSGGNSSTGTLFCFDPVTGKDTVLVNLTALTGNYPKGNVIQAQNGLLYGLTSAGGASGSGVLFSYNISSGKDSVLISFADSTGTSPLGTLIQASDGKLYGVTSQGGANSDGVLFCYNIITGKDSVVVNFADTNGNMPVGALVQAKNGFLYGATQSGGTSNLGVLYRYNPVTGQDTVLANFNWSNGANPENGLMLASDGSVYGMTFQGGSHNAGVIYSHNPVTLQDTFIINLSSANGYSHKGGLLQAKNGLIYGLQSQGGLNSMGTLFSYNIVTGLDTVLVNFNNTNGSSPYGTPIQASNGLLYGTTYVGGVNSAGTLFSYNINTGKDSVLVNFNNTNGGYPYGDLLEAMSYTISGKDTLPCFGDSNAWAKIIARGGKAPISFLWNNGSTSDSIGGLKKGVYTCIVKDSTGKILNATVQIYEPELLTANTFVHNVCKGNSAVAWVSPGGGTGPYTYLWNNSNTADTLSGLAPGKDTCIITDAHGCRTSAVAVIANAQPMKIDSIVTTPTSCAVCYDGSASAYVSGGIPPGDPVFYHYLWTYGTDSSTVYDIPSGYDALCVLDTNGCGTVCDSGFVVTGIKQLSMDNGQWTIFPNPSSGVFRVERRAESAATQSLVPEIEIYTAMGQKVYSAPFSTLNSQLSIDLSSRPDGVYILQLNTGQGIVTRKLVIQR